MLKARIKKMLLLIALALLVILPFNSCLRYLVQAGYGQMQILMEREPIEGVLKSPKTDSLTKKKLMHVLSVQKFAGEKLGLNTANSYKKYSIINRDAAAYNVTACKELSFEPKTWWFPIVGRVPYLGFFSRDKAEKLKARLDKEGWDTEIGEVAGYSTLGWFEDPLLSSQIKYSEWYLTRLVIHEAVHATLWIPDDVTFNESLASFVEMEGAILYYEYTEGGESSQRKKEYQKESLRINELFHLYATMLDEIYKSGISDSEKRIKKKETIENFKNEIQKMKEKFKYISVSYYLEKNYNNADFLSYLRYESGQDFFQEIFSKCGNEWKCFFSEAEKFKKMDPSERKMQFMKKQKPVIKI